MRLALSIVSLTAALCACAMMFAPDQDSGTHALALQDAYLVAHGMAASYAESAEANPLIVEQLRRLDRKAEDTLEAYVSSRGGDEESTEQAIAALTNFAAHQTTATPQ